MIKTVIFDMDGVIIDSEPVHQEAFYHTFDAMGISVSEIYYDELKGFSTLNMMQKIKEDFNLDIDPKEWVEKKRDCFNSLFDNKADLDLIPGVLAIIQKLHQYNIQLILASSSAKVTIDRIFKRFDLYKYFSHIVSGEDFPKSKPHPAIFLKAWELSGHEKEECIVIEDSTNGIEAAKAAGLYCVAYKSKNTHHQDYTKADEVTDDFNTIVILRNTLEL